MLTTPLPRRLAAEALGSGLLVAVVVGSGIAASRLSPDDVGLQLLENALATTFALGVLITWLGPVSGAHFNPAVSAAAWWTGRRDRSGPTAAEAVAYSGAQVAGAVAGAVLANAMFEEPLVAFSTTDRSTVALLTSEVVATAGLVALVLGLVRAGRAAWAGPAVGAWIGAAYFWTSSTSFANPAVTLGRTVSDTFAGIAPSSAPAFVAAQALGAVLGVAVAAVVAPVPPTGPRTAVEGVRAHDLPSVPQEASRA